MNLGAVRDRAQELRNSLDEMARALAFNAHNIRWCDTAPSVFLHYERLVNQRCQEQSQRSFTCSGSCVWHGCRSDILDKYAVMQVQYHNLTEQLWPLLKHLRRPS